MNEVPSDGVHGSLPPLYTHHIGVAASGIAQTLALHLCAPRCSLITTARAADGSMESQLHHFVLVHLLSNHRRGCVPQVSSERDLPCGHSP